MSRRVLSVGVAVAGLVLGAAVPAAANPAPRVTLQVAAPAQGATVNDTAKVTFTGTNLRAVKVYRFLDLVGTATVTDDGMAATVNLDTMRFRDGTTHLTAYGYGAGSSKPGAVTALKVKVDNATGDRHVPGYELVYGDERRLLVRIGAAHRPDLVPGDIAGWSYPDGGFAEWWRVPFPPTAEESEGR